MVGGAVDQAGDRLKDSLIKAMRAWVTKEISNNAIATPVPVQNEASNIQACFPALAAFL